MMNLECDNDLGMCPCGSGWFTLEWFDEPEDAQCGPAVCINSEGMITGYAGKLVCVECEEDWAPGLKYSFHGHLRSVEQVDLFNQDAGV